MLETIREYAADRLSAAGEDDALRRAHAAHFLAFAERHELERFVPFDEHRLGQLEAEHLNLHAALTWLDGAGDDERFVRLVAALGWSWWARGSAAEGHRWLERAEGRGAAGSPSARAKVAIAMGYNAIARDDDRRAEEVFAEQLARCRACDDAQSTAHMLLVLGALDYGRGEFARATSRLTEALALARALPDPVVAALASADVLAELGTAAHGQGRLDLALAHHQEALRLHREAGFTYGLMHSLVDLGDVTRDLGDAAGAAARYHEALPLARRWGQRRVVIWALEGLAGALAATGHAVLAATLFGAAERSRETTGTAYSSPTDRLARDRAVAAARAALGASVFDSAWAAGRSQPPERVIADALAAPAAPWSGPGVSLTARERDVLRGLAAGLTDRAIAETLFIGERTVESHVARVYAKLGVRSRAAATAAAIARGLVPPAPPTAAPGPAVVDPENSVPDRPPIPSFDG